MAHISSYNEIVILKSDQCIFSLYFLKEGSPIKIMSIFLNNLMKILYEYLKYIMVSKNLIVE